MKKRVKVGFKRFEYARESAGLDLALQSVNTLKSYLETVGLMLSEAFIMDSVAGCTLIVEAVRASIEEDIKGVKSVLVRNNAIEGIEGKINDLKMRISRLTGLIDASRNLDLIEVSNGIAKIKDDAEAILIERNTVYISDPREIQIYEAHKKASIALSEFAELLGKGREISKLNVSAFFSFDERTISPEEMAYSVLASDRQ